MAFMAGPVSAKDDGSSAPDAAQGEEKWHAPFGGTFNAQLTVTSDYSYAGISANALQPAFQIGLDYRSPDLLGEGHTPVWFYLTGWGSNATLPTGSTLEVDLTAGMKAKLSDKLKLDVSYIQILYPGQQESLGYNYGDIAVNVDYDFGPAAISGRVRFSPNSFGNSGWEWNKRAMLSAPLTFLPWNDKVPMRAYGALGNFWVERPLQYGIPSNDYWYWQLGVVTSYAGFDFMVAYTDTSISDQGCNYTGYCAGRVFVSLTKAF